MFYNKCNSYITTEIVVTEGLLRIFYPKQPYYSFSRKSDELRLCNGVIDIALSIVGNLRSWSFATMQRTDFSYEK